jgi:hypothetical protein
MPEKYEAVVSNCKLRKNGLWREVIIEQKLVEKEGIGHINIWGIGQEAEGAASTKYLIWGCVWK